MAVMPQPVMIQADSSQIGNAIVHVPRFSLPPTHASRNNVIYLGSRPEAAHAILNHFAEAISTQPKVKPLVWDHGTPHDSS